MRVPGVRRVRSIPRRLWKAGKALVQDRVLILAYHRVAPSAECDPLQLIVTADNFAGQMAWLRRHFEVARLEDVAEQLRQSHLRRRRQVVITFDDGYWDNRAFAAPILEQYGLPATVYLTAGYIGTQRKFWWDVVTDIITRSKSAELQVATPIGRRYRLGDERSRIAAIVDLCSGLRKLPVDARDLVLTRLAAHGGFDGGDARPMTWSDARALRAYGIAVGAHTCNHQALSALPVVEARREIEEAKRIIEAELQCEVRHFSYPHDDEDYYRQRVSETPRRLAASAGFESAVTIVRGANTVRDDRMALKRLMMRNWDAAQFSAKIGRAFTE